MQEHAVSAMYHPKQDRWGCSSLSNVGTLVFKAFVGAASSLHPKWLVQNSRVHTQLGACNIKTVKMEAVTEICTGGLLSVLLQKSQRKVTQAKPVVIPFKQHSEQ